MLSLDTTTTLRSNGDIPANTDWAPDSRLAALCTAHDDLDAAITALLQTGLSDALLLTRLKKRKLQLKDEIAAAQNEPAAVSQAF
jgi:hypothetical protein